MVARLIKVLITRQWFVLEVAVLFDVGVRLGGKFFIDDNILYIFSGSI